MSKCSDYTKCQSNYWSLFKPITMISHVKRRVNIEALPHPYVSAVFFKPLLVDHLTIFLFSSVVSRTTKVLASVSSYGGRSRVFAGGLA